jgi:Fur family ferric uptake transcriptional regulator
MNHIERLKVHLGNNGLKMTGQRKVILETLENLEHHVSLEELLLAVQKKKQGVGMATIYRTMKLFMDAEIVEEHRFDDGLTRFELSHEGDHHDHLICELCGYIVEFEDDIIEERQRLIAAQYGMKITNHKMELYGHCVDVEKCKKRQWKKR